MREFFKQYISDSSWMITEEGWDRNKQGIMESQFTLGNGFIGSRGILEEIPRNAYPGTYISGLFDKAGAKVTTIVNLPNPVTLDIYVDGEKLDIGTMKVLKHSRQLNMGNGLLIRHTLFRDNRKNRIDYQSMRFVSMHDKSLIAILVYFTPLDGPVTIAIESLIDLSTVNAAGVMEPRKRHYRIKEVYSPKGRNYVCVSTFEKRLLVAYITSLRVTSGKKDFYLKEDYSTLRVEKGQSICLTKIINMEGPESWTKALRFKKRIIARHERSLKLGSNNLLLRHIRAWKKKWKNADIAIKPDNEIQKALRFNIYHLLICADKWDMHNGIGARTLSGEGYRGHIFWDSDIFTLPFFVYTNPAIAKNLLLYRYDRLDAARDIAKSRGYKGAMFPWESADSGCEETPTWAKNLDKSIIRIWNHLREQHITADVAYAYYYYYTMTGDEEFMLKYGYEVMFETARFWASRVELNKKMRRYEIRHVIGPDEFHEDVNNNAFTNMLAKWNLLTTFRLFCRIKNKYPVQCARIVRKIGLNEKEARQWKRIAPRIMINKRKDNVIEQFDGFFKKRKILIKELDRDFMPVFPRDISFREVGDTQLVKQADVLMLLFLLSDVYNFRTKRSNFDFYTARTVHKSSLSHSVHSIVSAEAGELTRAYHFFLVALNADLQNKHGNTAEGIHAASLGGVWQAVVRGFAGVKLVKEVLTVKPEMPKGWKSVVFSIKRHGNTLTITVTEGSVRIRAMSRSRTGIKLVVYNRERKIKPGREYVFYKRGGRG